MKYAKEDISIADASDMGTVLKTSIGYVPLRGVLHTFS